MALGIPVITTDVGAEGIDEDGKVLIIANTEESFKKELINLLSNNQLYHEKSEAVQDFVSENFNWDESEKLLNKIYNKNK